MGPIEILESVSFNNVVSDNVTVLAYNLIDPYLGVEKGDNKIRGH